mgnify:FL=1
MKNSTKTLFSQCVNLCDGYLSPKWVQGIRTNMFDSYHRDNKIDSHLSIYHYGGDVFKVETMHYDDSKGCLIGTSSHIGSFDNIQDAEKCAEKYLKDLS